MNLSILVFWLNFPVGVVDKLLKGFENSVFPTKKAGLLFMNNYLKKVDFCINFTILKILS